MDMDIWLEPSNTNRDRLAEALDEFGIDEQDLSILKSKDFSQPTLYFFGEKPRRIDFLNKIQGITFDEAYPQVNHFPLKDQQIPIIQYHHLILSKITNKREKDKADVEELQRIHSKKNH